ncbi:centrosomal protein of 104 kDa [Schistocerca serialis cubense]|uniref:centrosomal protein of 104 kDa n=1 Tax=Schistocerca serialis cubense TaxID=2023355 RepID=UPI00214E2302|nr:centrosomal protein of 104 kDa [Schistocerca serialis cubense]
MPHKIGFTVIYATGEDEHHRATELNVHGPTVRGWQSAQACTYPQELVLQLHAEAVVSRIQILAHQFLIPERLELWAGSDVDESDPQSVCGSHFEYLGYITLSSNESTAFKSRELKSVTVPSCKARFLKLRLHKNHPNAFNVHNQVSLIAVNVLGQLCEPDGCGRENNNNGLPNNHNALLLVSNPQYTSPYDDLAFEMYVDPEVASIIRTMEAKKQQAVINERFEYARRLKLAMADLRVAGERLSKLELEKRHAISCEDYDRAKLKKSQLDQYRHTVYRFLEVDDLLELSGPVAKNDESLDVGSAGHRPELPLPPRLLQVSPQPPPASAAAAAAPAPAAAAPTAAREGATSPLPAPPAMHQSPVSPLHHHTRPKTPPAHVHAATATEGAPAAARVSPSSSPTNMQLSHSHSQTQSLQLHTGSLRSSQRRRNKSAGAALPARNSYEAYEERTVPALRHCHASSLRECQVENETSTRSKISEREKKQAALPITVFGLELVEKFYSKQYSDKEEGLQQLKDVLRAYASGEKHPEQPTASPNKIARAAIFLLHRALRDKVYSVYSLAAENIRLFFSEFVPTRVTSAEVSRSVERLLPELLSKSGDTTPRIHNMAVHTILSMADCQEVRELHIIPVHLTRPLTSSIHPRLALSRIEMVEQLVLSHGISTDKQSGLTCRVLAEFGSSGLHHPAEAVRKVAERVLTLVYRVNPRLVRKQLPPDDDITRRNLLYRQLFHEFDLIDMQRKREVLERNRQVVRAAAQVTNVSTSPTNNANVNKSPGHQTGSSSSSASIITSPSDASQQDVSDDKMCIFCLVRAENFTEEGLNIHYWRSCPMLTRCVHCKQVVEISVLSHHLTDECDMRHLYKKCERCTEAILEDYFDDHINSTECVPVEPLSTANHCPLCHSNIPPWEDGWRQHLMNLPCPNHPRKKHIKNRSKSPPEDKHNSNQ